VADSVRPAAENPVAGAIDTSIPHSARFWNYWLGGKDNYPVDREIADQIAAEWPGLVDVARTSRRFLIRAVEYLVVEAGVRQFLDVGTGLPTADNTHEVAQRAAPDARIVYVDNDPLVLTHARALLTSTPEGATAYLDADLRDTDAIIAGAGEVLDLTQPVALILMGVLGHVPEPEAAKDIVDRLMAKLPSGSYLVHYDGSDTSPGMVKAQDSYNTSGAIPYFVRSPETIRGFHDGLELVEPGVVRVTDWRPRETDAEDVEAVDAFGGVGRKP